MFFALRRFALGLGLIAAASAVLIAGNVPDSGSFVWTVGSSVPSKFYLRLEIRDAAGNVGRVETPQPTLIDLSRPTAKFMEIEVGPQ